MRRRGKKIFLRCNCGGIAIVFLDANFVGAVEQDGDRLCEEGRGRGKGAGFGSVRKDERR